MNENEFIDGVGAELEMWAGLARVDERTGGEDDGQRAHVVADCLELLAEMWDTQRETATAPCPLPKSEDFDGGPEGAGDGGVSRAGGKRPRFGRFVIERQLGCGAHGFVYLATDPVLERAVAIKIPSPESLTSTELRGRLVEESRALARLEHPNLLPILEAGTVGPVCYLVTPYCAGPSLADWVRQQAGPLDCELAAGVVCDVARTLAYVHSRGILHRDIKPGNVLLEPVDHPSNPLCAGLPTPHSDCGVGRPAQNWNRAQNRFNFVPKLADFGLAKFVSGSAMRTVSGGVVGTPMYMAPEQAAGRHGEIGVATEVYALGAMLYELMTGRPPFRGEGVAATLQLILEGRLAPPERLRADVPRDLSAICMKCLEYEPGRRYRTADELADDLTAYLECRPVTARTCGPVGRVSKWGRRRPRAAALAALAATAAVVAVAAIGWQWRQTRAHQRQGEQSFRVAHGAIQRIHEVLLAENTYDAPEFSGLRNDILHASIPYYHELLEMESDNPELRAGLADACLQLGYIAADAERREEASRWFVKSAGLWQRLVEEEPTDRDYRYYLAKAHGRIGQMLQMKSDAGAEERLEQSAALHEQLLREFPSFHNARWELSGTLCDLVELSLDGDEFQRAKQLADRAIAVLLAVAPEARCDMIEGALAKAYLRSAEAHFASGEPEESAARCREAVELSGRLAAQESNMASSLSTLAGAQRLLARLSTAAGELEQAGNHLRGGIDVSKELARRYGDCPKYGRKVVGLYAELADHFCRQARYEDAIGVHQEAIRYFERQVGDWDGAAELRGGLADACLGAARVRSAMGDRPGALEDGEQAVTLYGQLVEEAGESDAVAGRLAYCLRFLAGVHGSMGNHEHAAELYREAIRLQQKLVAAHPDQARHKRDLADYYTGFATQQRERRSCEEAAELYQRARELLEPMAEDFPDDVCYRLRLIRCHYLAAYNFELLGRLEEATAALDRGKELVLGLTPEAKLALADERHRIFESFQLAAHVRAAAGDSTGGPEQEWLRSMRQSKS